MRQEELKEYRAGFCRSIGLIYAFTPFLAYKHPWNEEPVLLSLSYSPASTLLGKSTQQQNLKPAVGPGRRWFSSRMVNHVGYACSVPACQRAVEETAAAEWAVCSALSSGSRSNPWSVEQNHLQRLKNAAVSPIAPPNPFAMTCPKKSASISLCGDLNADEKILLLLGAIPLPKLFPHCAEVMCLGNTRPAPHPTGVVSTGVSGHWVP